MMFTWFTDRRPGPYWPHSSNQQAFIYRCTITRMMHTPTEIQPGVVIITLPLDIFFKLLSKARAVLIIRRSIKNVRIIVIVIAAYSLIYRWSVISYIDLLMMSLTIWVCHGNTLCNYYYENEQIGFSKIGLIIKDTNGWFFILAIWIY